jgi:hypothetical protein
MMNCLLLSFRWKKEITTTRRPHRLSKKQWKFIKEVKQVDLYRLRTLFFLQDGDDLLVKVPNELCQIQHFKPIACERRFIYSLV